MDIHRSMTVFVEVAHAGSIAAAARHLGISAPSASRLLSDLENWLGQPLVRRTTRHLSLTDLGERYLGQCEDILRQTDALRTDLESNAGQPSGPLRVTASGILARKLIAPIIPRFLAENPAVSLEIDTRDRVVDLMSEKLDLAIRVGHLEDSSLVAQKLCETRGVLVASEVLLDRLGTPDSPDDLKDYPCLIDTVPRYSARWPFLKKRSVTGPAKISDGDIIRDLAIAGLGIAYLPDLFVQEDLEAGILTEILPQVTTEIVGIHAIYPPKPYINPAARALVDLVLDRSQ